MSRVSFVFLFLVSAVSQALESQIGAGLYPFKYAEELVLPKKSTETGILPVVRGSVEGSFAGIGFLRAMADFTSGGTLYDGSTQTGVPLQTTTQNFLLNMEVQGGRSVFSPDTEVFAGIGYHLWVRDIQGEKGLKEDYEWPYAAIGARANWQFARYWTLLASATVKLPFAGSMRIHFSRGEGDVPVYVALGDRIGFRAEVPIQYRPWGYESVGFQITPWFETRPIGLGPDTVLFLPDRTLYIHEPASTAYSYGVMLSAIFTNLNDWIDY